MGKAEIFRKALAMPEVVQNVELTNHLRHLQEDYFKLLEENSKIKEKLKKIEDISEIKKNAKANGAIYTLEGVEDIRKNPIPFCFNCLYEHNLQIPLQFGVIERGMQDLYSGETVTPTTYGYKCNKCGTKSTAVKNS